jgi:molecular chaperone DnaK
MQGDVKDILLLDVTPLSVGIETLGGVFTRLIEKNTTIPTAKTQIFSTAADNQTSVEINVLQGEREMAADNKTLARFILDGIPPSPRGMPQVEVTFDLDANGILNVSAKDKASGKTQSVKIEATTSLSKEEVERLKNEAKLHEVEDKKKRELVDLKNTSESTVYMAEKALKDIPADKAAGASEVIKSVQEKIDALKGVKDSTSVEAIKKALSELSAELQKIGQYLNQQSQTPPAGTEGPAKGGNTDGGQQPPSGEQPQEGTESENK